MDYFRCPITLEVMKEPVNTKYGHAFEKSAIEAQIEKYGRCPVTNLPLSKKDIIPNFTLKNAIEEYRQKKLEE